MQTRLRQYIAIPAQSEPTRLRPRWRIPGRYLLDDGFDAVITGPKAVDEGFGLRIGGQRDGQIRISREPRLGSNGDSQAADERERDVGSGEIGGDLT